MRSNDGQDLPNFATDALVDLYFLEGDFRRSAGVAGEHRMKKLAVALLMTGLLAEAGFAAPANAAPKDQDSTTSSNVEDLDRTCNRWLVAELVRKGQSKGRPSPFLVGAAS